MLTVRPVMVTDILSPPVLHVAEEVEMKVTPIEIVEHVKELVISKS